MTLTAFGQLVLFSLPIVVLFFFALMPSRKATIISFLYGWLMLPMRAYSVHGLSEYSKLSMTALSVLLATLIFDSERFLKFRPRIWDLPAVLFLICPFFSSMHNNLGAYDGGNAVVNQFHLWFGGYLVGRLYFTDLESMRDLALGIVLGGIVYAPLCLYESRMSPNLHKIIYGFLQHDFSQTRRLGGWRPIVFMQHGIAVGNWMAASTLCAWWLWYTGVFKRRWGLPALAWVFILAVTLYFCHAFEAILLLAGAMALLFTVKQFHWRWTLVALLLVAPTYTFLRADKLWSGRNLVTLAAKFSEDRSKSLEFRLYNEDEFITHALISPVYGWGGWNRFRTLDERGRPVVPDQEWIIAFGKTGVVGLVSFELMLLVPVVVLMRRVSVKHWAHPGVAPAVVLAMVVAFHMIDCLFNAMVNPIFMMACGGVTGMLPVTIRYSATQRPRHAGIPRRSMSHATPTPVPAFARAMARV